MSCARGLPGQHPQSVTPPGREACEPETRHSPESGSKQCLAIGFGCSGVDADSELALRSRPIEYATFDHVADDLVPAGVKTFCPNRLRSERAIAQLGKIGSAHVCHPATNAQIECSHLRVKTTTNHR